MRAGSRRRPSQLGRHPLTRALVLLILGLTAAGCSGGSGPSAPRATTSTTGAPVDSTLVAAPSTTVITTTTTSTLPGRPRTTVAEPVEIGPGAASLAGSVVGPQGLVAGAKVVVERIVGEQSATVNLSAADGRFSLSGIRGGSYRIRAWRAPDLALVQPEVFFLGADENRTLELRLARLADTNVRVDVEPDKIPPSEPFTATVQVFTGTVADDGTITGVSRPGVSVQLLVGPGLSLQGPDRASTDAAGKATFRLRCTAPGAVSADAIVELARLPLALPACPA